MLCSERDSALAAKSSSTDATSSERETYEASLAKALKRINELEARILALDQELRNKNQFISTQTVQVEIFAREMAQLRQQEAIRSKELQAKVDLHVAALKYASERNAALVCENSRLRELEYRNQEIQDQADLVITLLKAAQR